MVRGKMDRAVRWAVVLMSGASLAACASLTTPKYSIREDGPRAQAAQGAHGSSVKPQAAPGVHGTDAPYQVGGIWYVPHDQPHYDETGIASWYGDAFNMKATANGEIFDMTQISAAHTTLPLPSMVEVTNLDNGRRLTVRVNDRGPFVGGRLIDLSHAAAIELGYDRAAPPMSGCAMWVRRPLAGPDAGVRYAKASPPAYAPAASKRAPRRMRTSSPTPIRPWWPARPPSRWLRGPSRSKWPHWRRCRPRPRACRLRAPRGTSLCRRDR